MQWKQKKWAIKESQLQICLPGIINGGKKIILYTSIILNHPKVTTQMLALSPQKEEAILEYA